MIDPALSRRGETVNELLADATPALAPVTDNARLDAEILLSHALGVSRASLRAWPGRRVDGAARAGFRALLARRRQGEPLAYLIGEREFWSLSLCVTPATLIPRPETELLVEQALACIPAGAAWRIADLGTGSGAIALAIASERRDCNIVATDISDAALAVARRNQTRLAMPNVAFRRSDWFEGFGVQPFNLIVANPPYIDDADPHLLSHGLPFEPRHALTPGADGLAAIRAIIRQAPRHMVEPGWVMLEHGLTQGGAVRALFLASGYVQVSTVRDLGDRERVTMARWSDAGRDVI